MIPAADLDLARSLAVIALEAGKAILDVYAQDFAVTRKPDASPVTEADRLGEEIILDGLKAAYPGLPVLAEEAAAAGRIPALGRAFFLVDPLDGTREFINRNGEFTVNIALIENGRASAGVVLAPALGELFVAATGCGAMRLPAPHSPPELDRLDQAQRLTSAAAAPGALRAITSRSHRDEETGEFLARLGVRDIIYAGSSLKFCRIAAGEADVYPRFGRTMEWDTGAGQAVLECAGGAVLTMDGAPLRYGKQAAGYANPAFVAWGRKPQA